MKKAILPIAFIALAAAIIYLWVRVENPFTEAPAPDKLTVEVAESGQPMGAAIAPKEATVYVSYLVVRGNGAYKNIGATWVKTRAWIPQDDQNIDNGILLRDLMAVLKDKGLLDGLDTAKTGNWVTVLWPGAAPKIGWILDTRDVKK